MGFSYFRKPASETDGAEEIFCDEDSRRQMLERVMKGRVLPLAILFFCTILPQFLIHMFSTHNYAAAAVMGLVMLIYIGVFILFAWKYRQFEERHGQTGKPARYLPLSRIRK